MFHHSFEAVFKVGRDFVQDRRMDIELLDGEIRRMVNEFGDLVLFDGPDPEFGLAHEVACELVAEESAVINAKSNVPDPAVCADRDLLVKDQLVLRVCDGGRRGMESIVLVIDEREGPQVVSGKELDAQTSAVRLFKIDLIDHFLISCKEAFDQCDISGSRRRFIREGIESLG
jgi:hypothetical protein